jgi:hypothetical protein
VNVNKLESAEFIDLVIGIEAGNADSCREIARFLNGQKQDLTTRRPNPEFAVTGVSEHATTLGAVEPSFWVDLVMKVPVSIAVTVLSAWLCEVVKEARAKERRSSDCKESIHIGGLTVTIEGDETSVRRKLNDAIEGEIRRKKIAHRRK